jgi:hypothetical protein
MTRALALFVVLGCSSPSKPPPAQPAVPPPGAPAGDETFTGTITEANFGCAVDASCDLVVDNTKRVHFGHDTRMEGRSEWGNTEQVYELMEAPNQGVGRRVEVFAKKQPDGGYTLQGKAAYYIKVLPP